MVAAVAVVDVLDDGHQQPFRSGQLLEGRRIDLEAADRLLRAEAVVDEKPSVVDEQRGIRDAPHIAAMLPAAAVGIRRADHFGRPGRAVALEPDEIEVFAVGRHGRSHVAAAVLRRITDFGSEGDVLPVNQIVRDAVTARIVRRKEVVAVFEQDDHGIGRGTGSGLLESAPTVVEVDRVAIGGSAGMSGASGRQRRPEQTGKKRGEFHDGFVSSKNTRNDGRTTFLPYKKIRKSSGSSCPETRFVSVSQPKLPPKVFNCDKKAYLCGCARPCTIGAFG